MPDAQNQAERYRHLAEEYRRLTATSYFLVQKSRAWAGGENRRFGGKLQGRTDR